MPSEPRTSVPLTAGVANDAQEPRAAIAARERSKVPERAQRRILHDVFRILVIAISVSTSGDAISTASRGFSGQWPGSLRRRRAAVYSDALHRCPPPAVVRSLVAKCLVQPVGRAAVFLAALGGFLLRQTSRRRRRHRRPRHGSLRPVRLHGKFSEFVMVTGDDASCCGPWMRSSAPTPRRLACSWSPSPCRLCRAGHAPRRSCALATPPVGAPTRVIR